MRSVDSGGTGSTPRDRSRARGVLSFVAPRPWRWLQRLAFQINRVVVLGMGIGVPGSVEPVFSRETVNRLRSIPAGAGNVMVGPHSGTHDAYLMYELCRVAGRMPAGFFMAAEYYADTGVLGRALLRRLGAIPVARGRHNPQAVRYMARRLAEGNWCGLFPEGESYYSREVMPLEHGALRTAIEAALDDAGGRSVPILLTPFALVYFYTRPAFTLRRLDAVLAAIEARKEIFSQTRSGELPARIIDAADALMEHKARRYGVPRDAWDAADRFERVRRLQQVVIEDLECRYRGAVQEGFIRRRAIKIRMRIYERLRDQPVDAIERDRLNEDLLKIRDIIIAAPFSPRCLEKYCDLEMWIEYVRRMHVSLGLPQPDLGPQRAVIEVLPGIDVRPLAARYRALGCDAARTQLLSDETEKLRETLQRAVDAICARHPRARMGERAAGDAPASNSVGT